MKIIAATGLLLPIATIAAIFVSLCLPARAAEPPSHYALVQATLDKSVLPGVEALKVSAARLPDAVARVCTRNDARARNDLHKVFRETVLAWAGVEYLRFGPLADGGRRERMSFWPDPRGVMARQLRQIFASKDQTVTEAGTIAKQSAAVQGLPALEVLLTDKQSPLGPGEASAFRCKFARAIAGNVSGLANEIVDDWTKLGGWKERMLRPGSDNATYKEPQEAASELVKAMLVGFQLVGDGQLKPKLDAANRAKFAGPFAKSELSKAYFEAGVASLNRLYNSLSLERYLSDDKAWVKEWAQNAWRNMAVSDGAGGRAAKAPKGEAPSVQKTFEMVGGMRKLVTAELSVAAGLTLGFNELDGD
jgi:predicted lipoprotein